MKKIRSYIRPGIAARIITLVLLVGAALAFLIGAVGVNFVDLSDAAPFEPNVSEKSSYCYFDVVGVSDWIFSSSYNDTTRTYYAAVNDEGYAAFLVIESKDYRNMGMQRAWWDNELEDPPAPYRVIGKAEEITPATYVTLSESMGYENANECKEYFGELILDGAYHPASEFRGACNLIALFGGMFGCIFFLCIMKPLRFTRRSLKRLENEDMLDRAAEEFDTAQHGKGYTFTDHFLFIPKQGIALGYHHITSCAAGGGNVKFSTDKFGDVFLHRVPQEDMDRLLAALPLKADEAEQVVVLKR